MIILKVKGKIVQKNLVRLSSSAVSGLKDMLKGGERRKIQTRK